MNNKMTRGQAEAAAAALLAAEPRFQDAWLGRTAALIKHRRLYVLIANSVAIPTVVEPVDFLNPGHAYWDGLRNTCFD